VVVKSVRPRGCTDFIVLGYRDRLLKGYLNIPVSVRIADRIPENRQWHLADSCYRATMYLHVSTSEAIMRLQLAKWGNSLAVRLPVECTRAAGLREGDTVEAEVTPIGEIKLTPAPPFDKAAFIKRLRKLRATMPMTTTTVQMMRQEDRY